VHVLVGPKKFATKDAQKMITRGHVALSSPEKKSTSAREVSAEGEDSLSESASPADETSKKQILPGKKRRKV